MVVEIRKYFKILFIIPFILGCPGHANDIKYFSPSPPSTDLVNSIKSLVYKGSCLKNDGIYKWIFWYDSGFQEMKYYYDYGSVNFIIEKADVIRNSDTEILINPYDVIDDSMIVSAHGIYDVKSESIRMECR